MHLVATRDIKASDEITVSYVVRARYRRRN